jgi:hypothetical protein
VLCQDLVPEIITPAPDAIFYQPEALVPVSIIWKQNGSPYTFPPGTIIFFQMYQGSDFVMEQVLRLIEPQELIQASFLLPDGAIGEFELQVTTYGVPGLLPGTTTFTVSSDPAPDVPGSLIILVTSPGPETIVMPLSSITVAASLADPLAVIGPNAKGTVQIYDSSNSVIQTEALSLSSDLKEFTATFNLNCNAVGVLSLLVSATDDSGNTYTDGSTFIYADFRAFQFLPQCFPNYLRFNRFRPQLCPRSLPDLTSKCRVHKPRKDLDSNEKEKQKHCQECQI